MVLIYEMIKSSVFVSYKFTPQILSLCKNKNSLFGIKNITKFPFSFPFLFPFPVRTRRIWIRMMHNSTTTSVDALQQVIHTTHTHTNGGGGWEQCWKQGLTPWDLGGPTPLLLHLHRTGSLPKGRALLPGCGTGYDVVAIAGPERYVIGLDISGHAINKAIQLSSSHPNSSYFTFLEADFFTCHPTDLFDLIFDYTFFCAIEPHLRSAWARKMADILKPDGELITLMFPISDHVGGPPYKVSVSDYEEVLHPMGFKAISITDNELAVGPRKAREKLGRWKRSSVSPAKSAL
ncbi:probable thiol methyltransferase 2 isoform X2 [Morus notabilis]|nr:probable thiol methyltransferase 2 isoform X2 [Morus notabilis]